MRQTHNQVRIFAHRPLEVMTSLVRRFDSRIGPRDYLVDFRPTHLESGRIPCMRRLFHTVNGTAL